MFDSILLHGRFGNLNTEFAEFTDDPWNTPADVGAGEFPDQILNLSIGFPLTFRRLTNRASAAGVLPAGDARLDERCCPPADNATASAVPFRARQLHALVRHHGSGTSWSRQILWATKRRFACSHHLTVYGNYRDRGRLRTRSAMSFKIRLLLIGDSLSSRIVSQS